MEKQNQGRIGSRPIKCKKCGVLKSPTAYYKSHLTKSGLRGSCKECTRAQDKQYREEHIEEMAVKTKRNYLLRKYNITVEEYEEAMASSNRCEICNTSRPIHGIFNYDHCHTTNKFRGVLCRKCNQAIGALGDTAEALKIAYEYLKRFEDNKEIKFEQ